METIHGAALVVLSLPEHVEGEYVGGILTIATPLGKNWRDYSGPEIVAKQGPFKL